jgi:hypothetical protein
LTARFVTKDVAVADVVVASVAVRVKVLVITVVSVMDSVETVVVEVVVRNVNQLVAVTYSVLVVDGAATVTVGA